MLDEPTLTLVEEAAPSGDVDDDQADPTDEAAERRIVQLEDRLMEAVASESEAAQHLAELQTRIATLTEDLHTAREEAVAESVAEAERRREAILAEAETMHSATIEDAEREAAQITQQAFTKSKSILAAAKEEAVEILASRQSEISRLEAEAKQRIERLEADEDELMGRIEFAKVIFGELQETLRAVAEASINELATAKSALMEMHEHARTPRRRSTDA